MKNIELMVTLWPSFPHFPEFAKDRRLSGIRLNSAMMNITELDEQLSLIKTLDISVPLFFDIKSRQMRVSEVHDNKDHLDITLNHAISVKTPTEVLFKAGLDMAVLKEITEGGKRLIFYGGPEYKVKPGESLHIRHPSLRVFEPIFTDLELEKIAKVKGAGFAGYYLSYVEAQSDVDQFLELVGHDSLVYLKIESKGGLNYVAKEFKKRPNLVLVVARGDLYVEVDRPHDILAAHKLILSKDPEACVGSRILLSVVSDPVPSLADFSELAWLYDSGFRRYLLCDELCLKQDLLETAVNAFESFQTTYSKIAAPRPKSFFRSVLRR